MKIGDLVSIKWSEPMRGMKSVYTSTIGIIICAHQLSDTSVDAFVVLWSNGEQLPHMSCYLEVIK